MADKEKPPEFEIFKRVEELEGLWLEKADSDNQLQEQADDAFFLGSLGYVWSLDLMAEEARKKGALNFFLDSWIDLVKKRDDITDRVKKVIVKHLEEKKE